MVYTPVVAGGVSAVQFTSTGGRAPVRLVPDARLDPDRCYGIGPIPTSMSSSSRTARRDPGYR